MEQEEVVRRLERIRNHYKWMSEHAAKSGTANAAAEWQKDAEALDAAIFICRGES